MELIMLTSTRNLEAEEGVCYFYIPLFANSSHLLESSSLSSYYSFFLALELFLIFISGVLNGALIFALSSSSLIHKNLKIIWIAHLFEYFIYSLAQILLVCHQVGMYKISGRISSDIWLVLAAFVKMYFMWGTLLVQMATVIERAIATKYINNYETMKSRKIAVSFAVLKSLLSMFISASIVSTFLRYTAASVLVAIVLSSTALLYIGLLSYNSRLLSSTMISVYTLSSKYQVTENIRILTLLRNVFILISFAVILIVSLMGILRLMEYGELVPFAAVLVDMIIAGLPIEIMLVAGWHFREKGRRRRGEEPTADEYARESLLYFKQLNSSWSKRNTKLISRR